MRRASFLWRKHGAGYFQRHAERIEDEGPSRKYMGEKQTRYKKKSARFGERGRNPAPREDARYYSSIHSIGVEKSR